MMMTMTISSVTTLEVSPIAVTALLQRKPLARRNRAFEQKERSRRSIIAGFVKGRGRTGFSIKNFNPGDFIYKYKAIVRKKKADWEEKTNAELGFWCYCLDFTYERVTYNLVLRLSIMPQGNTLITPADIPIW